MTARDTPAACASRPMALRKAWKSPPHCAACAGAASRSGNKNTASQRIIYSAIRLTQIKRTERDHKRRLRKRDQPLVFRQRRHRAIAGRRWLAVNVRDEPHGVDHPKLANAE